MQLYQMWGAALHPFFLKREYQKRLVAMLTSYRTNIQNQVKTPKETICKDKMVIQSYEILLKVLQTCWKNNWSLVIFADMSVFYILAETNKDINVDWYI